MRRLLQGVASAARLGRPFYELIRLGTLLYPETTLSNIRHRAALLVHGMRKYHYLAAWHHGASRNRRLTMALERFPQTLGAIYWPYMHRDWAMTRRLELINDHYRMLEGRASILHHAVFTRVQLASLENEYPGLRLVLDKAGWFMREGEIVLNLFANQERLYSLAFTLGSENGAVVAYVGALQGSNVAGAKAIYRDITVALHRMRPRDFIVAALKSLCQELGVTRIYAISSDSRQHRAPYFGNEHEQKVLANYDEVWTEHGGTRLDNGFFDVPVGVAYREQSRIPSRKRASYRRRYLLLERVAKDIASNCALHDSDWARAVFQLWAEQDASRTAPARRPRRMNSLLWALGTSCAVAITVESCS